MLTGETLISYVSPPPEAPAPYAQGRQMSVWLLRSGPPAVLECTTNPRAIDGVSLEKRSDLRAALDLSVAFFPEGIDLGSTPRGVRSFAPSCAEAAAIFFAKLCEQEVGTASRRDIDPPTCSTEWEPRARIAVDISYNDRLEGKLPPEDILVAGSNDISLQAHTIYRMGESWNVQVLLSGCGMTACGKCL